MTGLKCLWLFDLENSDDLGKSFCVVMCFTLTEIKHKKNTIEISLGNV